jgi:hypothetical protein
MVTRLPRGVVVALVPRAADAPSPLPDDAPTDDAPTDDASADAPAPVDASHGETFSTATASSAPATSAESSAWPQGRLRGLDEEGERTCPEEDGEPGEAPPFGCGRLEG